MVAALRPCAQHVPVGQLYHDHQLLVVVDVFVEVYLVQLVVAVDLLCASYLAHCFALQHLDQEVFVVVLTVQHVPVEEVGHWPVRACDRYFAFVFLLFLPQLLPRLHSLPVELLDLPFLLDQGLGLFLELTFLYFILLDEPVHEVSQFFNSQL